MTKIDTKPIRNWCSSMRAWRKLSWLAALGVLAAAGAARADVEIKVDPFDEAGQRGVSITELDRVWTAIYGSAHFDVREITKREIRLGTRDTEGAKAQATQRRDIDDDGYPDLLTRFDMEETGLRESAEKVAVLSFALEGERRFRRAYDPTLELDEFDTTTACAAVTSGAAEIGVRCTFTSSLADDTPLDLTGFIESLNEQLNTSDEIESDSWVVIELWGGLGHEGSEEYNCTVGQGGGRGYAQTILTVQVLSDITVTNSELFLYVGDDGPNYQRGGSSSLLTGQSILSVDGDAQDPSEVGVVAIAGSGGGGGKATSESEQCERGYQGGDGGSATASTSAAASVAGDPGAQGNAGQGGNGDGLGAGGSGAGGSHSGDDGTQGIGGFGDEAAALWNGSDITDAQWTSGEGGEGGKGGDAGGGGGGFGGGGGGRAGDHKGGGGGGGSWAMQAEVDSTDVDSNLVLGPSYDPGYPAVVLTFSLSDDS